MSKISYDLKINDKKFINGVTDKYLCIDAAGSNVLELPVTFNYLDLFETMMDFIKTDSVAYDLTGSIAAGPFVLPYQTDGKFNIPNLPKVSLDQVEISKLFLAGASSLVFNLQIDNANQFDVNIKAFDYGIKLGGSQLAIQNINRN
ncbi:LEA type 2 family protein [Desulfobacterales bacterium HSG16]|nr:LEA type 2 family protein [Desulfobacterales bacterium HSG16]